MMVKKAEVLRWRVELRWQDIGEGNEKAGKQTNKGKYTYEDGASDYVDGDNDI